MKVLNTYIVGWKGKPIRVYETDSGNWYIDTWYDSEQCYALEEVEGEQLTLLKAVVHATGQEQ